MHYTIYSMYVPVALSLGWENVNRGVLERCLQSLEMSIVTTREVLPGEYDLRFMVIRIQTI